MIVAGAGVYYIMGIGGDEFCLFYRDAIDAKELEELVDKISLLATTNKGKILFGAGDNPYILLREKNLKGDKLIESVNNVLKCLQNSQA